VAARSGGNGAGGATWAAATRTWPRSWHAGERVSGARAAPRPAKHAPRRAAAPSTHTHAMLPKLPTSGASLAPGQRRQGPALCQQAVVAAWAGPEQPILRRRNAARDRPAPPDGRTHTAPCTHPRITPGAHPFPSALLSAGASHQGGGVVWEACASAAHVALPHATSAGAGAEAWVRARHQGPVASHVTGGGGGGGGELGVALPVR
jgi:hypothetical protein